MKRLFLVSTCVILMIIFTSCGTASNFEAKTPPYRSIQTSVSLAIAPGHNVTPMPKSRDLQRSTEWAKYVLQLAAVEDYGRTARRDQKKWYDHDWRAAFYGEIEVLIELSKDTLVEEQTNRLLVDFRMGMILADEKPIAKALDDIEMIKEMIK